MAVDAALLEGAVGPALRFYGWSPHAVSLGHFQRAADFADLPPGTPLVRRPTGGGAIHHGDELTFALVVDADRLPGGIAASYRAVHDVFVAALAALGVACERAASGPAPSPRPASRWCFASPTRDDVVTAAGKLLGSAQRRIRCEGRARVLHHGSLVLARPALTPFVAAVADQVAVDGAFVARLRDRVATGIGALIGEPAVAGGLTAAERALATRLCDDRFGAPPTRPAR